MSNPHNTKQVHKRLVKEDNPYILKLANRDVPQCDSKNCDKLVGGCPIHSDPC